MGDGLRATLRGNRRDPSGRHRLLEPSQVFGQRPAVPLIVCGLVVGVLLGLLLGWRVWPVQWYDTDPSDLRLQHQVAYVTLVSDSLAVTGDIEAARQRLAELTDGDTTWHQVANLVEMVAAEREAQGDPAAALRLRRMAQATGLPLATATEFSARTDAGHPTGLLYAAVAVVLLGLGVAGYLYGQARGLGVGKGALRAAPPSADTRRAPAPGPSRAPAPASWLDRAAPASTRGMPPVPSTTLDLQGEEDESLFPEPDDGAAGDDLADAPDDEFADDWEEEEEEVTPTSVIAALPMSEESPVARPGNGDAFLAEDDEEETPDDWEAEDTGEPSADEGEPPETEILAGAVPERVVRGVTAPDEAPDMPPDALGLFEAEYILGDDDFDSSFTIESPDGEFLGECGVGMTDVLDVEGGVQHADAFEVWLFDKSDIRTVTKVLVSEQAYRDEARSMRLSAKGELVVAQPGLEVMLETLSLRVTVTLRDCEFAEGSDGPEGYIVRLDLEMVAEPSDAIP
jgi:hypothetical protein